MANVENMLNRGEAIERIKSMAQEQGINGAFKVFYQGQYITSPSNLPDTVNMEELQISAMLDQAVKGFNYWFMLGGKVV